MLNIMLDKTTPIHFIGIGGAGMSGIAEVLLNKGYQVSGSDAVVSKNTDRLKRLGAKIFIGHSRNNIEDAELVVVSTAIADDNLELAFARERGILVMQRAQMLAQLMRDYEGIAVAGTHGKTTTTSLVAAGLTEGGLDPTYVVGGLVKSIGGNAYLGKSPYFVVEADESDASFLYLSPKFIIVTNIDADHMGTYGGSFDALCETFLKFINRLPDDGLAILCIDDPVIERLLDKITCPFITYGFHEKADVRCVKFKQNGIKSYFKVKRTGKRNGLILMANLQGRHNVSNALAMVALSLHLGVSRGAISRALIGFQGINRRFQMYGELKTPQGKVMLIDDYGHHPREVGATISAVREIWPERRLVMVFQPHRYSRTADLKHDFAKVLSETDRLLLLEVYSAGEAPIAGALGKDLFALVVKQKANKQSALFVEDIHQLPQVLETVLKEGDILLIQGAGSVGQLAYQLAWDYAELL